MQWSRELFFPQLPISLFSWFSDGMKLQLWTPTKSQVKICQWLLNAVRHLGEGGMRSGHYPLSAWNLSEKETASAKHKKMFELKPDKEETRSPSSTVRLLSWWCCFKENWNVYGWRSAGGAMGFTRISRVVLDNDSLSLLLAENKFSSLGKKHVYICICVLINVSLHGKRANLSKNSIHWWKS